MNIQTPDLKYNNPMGDDKLDEIIELFSFNSSQHIVDFGGGNGNVLRKVLSKTDATGTLVEIDADLIETCRKNAPDFINEGRLHLKNTDGKAHLKAIELSSIDGAICIGSSHVFGDYLATATQLKPYLKKGGLLLLGELYWKKEPDNDYLEQTGLKASELKYHHENMACVEALGMQYLYSNVASEDDWNRFEGKHYLINELLLQNEVDKEKRHAWRKAQIKYGRKTMGFGLYLFAKE